MIKVKHRSFAIPAISIPATPVEENTVSERRLHILSMRLILRACGSGGKKRYICMYVCMYNKRWA
jgi:hypothetical protein